MTGLNLLLLVLGLFEGLVALVLLGANALCRQENNRLRRRLAQHALGGKTGEPTVIEGPDAFESYQRSRRVTASYVTPSNAEEFILMLSEGAMGLSGECGEVTDAVKKHIYQGHDLDHEAIVSELGDVLWYLGFLADAMGVDLAYVAERNIKKCKLRYGDGFSAEKSVNRRV